jgi:hypothetical protein
MNNLVVVLIDEKKKIIYDSIFDIFKIIFGYEVINIRSRSKNNL